MKKSAKQLKVEARQAATNRGHMLSQFVRSSARLHFAVCGRCQRRVQIISSPLPNETEIGGEAVSVQCDGGAR